MSTDPLLELLRRKARFTHQELGDLLSLDKEAVAKRVASWEKDGTILGYHAVIDPESAGDTAVSAFIEVKVTPERGGGFDRLAMRIARFTRWFRAIWQAVATTSWWSSRATTSAMLPVSFPKNSVRSKVCFRPQLTSASRPTRKTDFCSSEIQAPSDWQWHLDYFVASIALRTASATRAVTNSFWQRRSSGHFASRQGAHSTW